MKKLCVFISLLLLVGAFIYITNVNYTHVQNQFHEEHAITKLLNEKPMFKDFPKKNGITKHVNIKNESTYYNNVMAELKTIIERIDEETYSVTFIKSWNLLINDEKVESYWIYEVQPEAMMLVRHQDKDDLINLLNNF
ncbi:hypothetical protein [Alkaliphilus peptidifermentans]|uniref:Uncharacterized protein n=1 Tax=Alkaliphilus peptidifermentans DSM 18978 TaxID=1120976 RepID=A0A1G5HLZ6_9FIRM|nr:hypothetical protein [Alkaliphilus peptidifermentans]SCY64783.1 hypothetical protein SAMN03080606_02042 [Alkaliphilus peptidifermentans DSM 18978]